MLRWQGREPLNLLPAIEADFDALFASFLGTSNDLSFVAFKRIWSKLNMSLIHQCHSRKSDPRLFIQAIFHAILQRLHHLPRRWDMENGQVIWERNGAKFPFLASLQHDESRETVWNIAVLYTLYCLYGTQIPMATSNVAVAGEHVVMQIQSIRIDPLLFLELNMAVDRIALVDLPVAIHPSRTISSRASSNNRSSSSSSSSSLSTSGTIGRGVVHLFHRLFYTMDAFTYSLHAGPANINTAALAQAKTLTQTPSSYQYHHDEDGEMAGRRDSSGSVRLRQIAEANEKIRGDFNISASGHNGSNNSSSSSSAVSPILAAMNADIAAVYHGGPIRQTDMTNSSADGDAADDVDAGVVSGNNTAGAAAAGVGINATASSSSSSSKIPLAERKQQVMLLRLAYDAKQKRVLARAERLQQQREEKRLQEIEKKYKAVVPVKKGGKRVAVAKEKQAQAQAAGGTDAGAGAEEVEGTGKKRGRKRKNAVSDGDGNGGGGSMTTATMATYAADLLKATQQAQALTKPRYSSSSAVSRIAARKADNTTATATSVHADGDVPSAQATGAGTGISAIAQSNPSHQEAPSQQPSAQPHQSMPSESASHPAAVNSSLVDAFEEFLNAQPLQPLPPPPPPPPPRPPSPIPFPIQQAGTYFGPSKRTSWGDRGGSGSGGGGGGSFGSVGLVPSRAKGKNKGRVSKGKGSTVASAAGGDDDGTSGQMQSKSGGHKSKKPKASNESMAQIAQAMAGVDGGDSIFELAAIIEQEARERNVDTDDEQESQTMQPQSMQLQPHSQPQPHSQSPSEQSHSSTEQPVVVSSKPPKATRKRKQPPAAVTTTATSSNTSAAAGQVEDGVDSSMLEMADIIEQEARNRQVS